MKTILTILPALALAGILSTLTARAEHHEKTLKGEALCAKCELKEADKCQTAIRVKDGDKTTIYYAKDNKVAQDFHKHVCSATVKVVAAGEVKESGGKQHITLSKIELNEKK
jgi:hypothetical protein